MALQESFISISTNTPSSGVTKFPIAPVKIRGLIPAYGGLMSTVLWDRAYGGTISLRALSDDNINSAYLAYSSGQSSTYNFPSSLGGAASLNQYDINGSWIISGSWEDLFIQPLGTGIQNVSKAGINGYRTDALINPYPWSFVQYGDTIIATNFGYPVQSMSMAAWVAAGTHFADLITSADKPRAKFCTVIGQHVLLANIYANGAMDGGAIPTGVNDSLVWWSRTGDPTKFGSPSSDPGNNTDYQQLYDIPGAITGVVGGSDKAVIFKEYGIYLMQLTGGPGLFSFTPILIGNGCINPRSICQVGDDIYFMSQNGYAVLKDMSNFQIIIDKNVNPEFFLWTSPENAKSDYMSKIDVIYLDKTFAAQRYTQKFYSVTWYDPVTGTVYFYNHNPLTTLTNPLKVIPPKVLSVNTETMEYSFWEPGLNYSGTSWAPAWILAASSRTVKDTESRPFSYTIFYGDNDGLYSTGGVISRNPPIGGTTCGNSMYRFYNNNTPTSVSASNLNIGDLTFYPAYIESEIFTLNKNTQPNNYSEIASKSNITAIRPLVKVTGLDLSTYGITITLYYSDKIQEKGNFTATVLNGVTTPLGYLFTVPNGKISSKYYYVRCDIPSLTGGKCVISFQGFDIQWDDSGNK